jgi:hypothetical protein
MMIDASDLLKAIGTVGGSVVITALGWLGYTRKKSSTDVANTSDKHEMGLMQRYAERVASLEVKHDELIKQIADSGMYKMKAELSSARVESLEADLDKLHAENKKLDIEIQRLKLLVVKMGGEPEKPEPPNLVRSVPFDDSN